MVLTRPVCGLIWTAASCLRRKSGVVGFHFPKNSPVVGSLLNVIFVDFGALYNISLFSVQ